MKKTKLLALIMVVAIMLTGAGYAFWSDVLVIDTRVTTGEFDVQFIDSKLSVREIGKAADGTTTVWNKPAEWLGKPDNIQTNGKLFHKISAVGPEKNNKLEVAFSNLYPGSEVRLDATIKNTGTIPAKVKEVIVSEFTGTKNKKLANKLTAIVSATHKDVDGDEITYLETERDLSKTGSMNNFKNNINEILVGLVLKPNETLSFDIPECQDAREEIAAELGIAVDQVDDECIRFTLGSKVINEDDVEDAELKFTMQIVWEQTNATGFNTDGTTPQ